MSDKNARLLRRETKRTLGRHLESFADGQARRLQTVEKRLGDVSKAEEKVGSLSLLAAFADANGRAAVQALEVEPSGRLLDVRLIEKETTALMEIRHRGFWGRVNWLVTGR